MTKPYLQPPGTPGGVRLLTGGTDWVLAAHRIPLPDGRVAHTLDTAQLTRPERIDFRLVRGPVPYATETYQLTDREGGTHVAFKGELGTDLWALGQFWGELVAKHWEAVVAGFLEDVKAEAEATPR